MLWHVGLHCSHRRPCRHRHCAGAVPHRPSSSSHHRTIPCHRVAVAPSIAVAPHHQSPSICHHAVHHRPLPLCSQSIAAALAPSLAVEEPSGTVPRRRGAVAPSLTVEEPSRRPLSSRSRCAIHCRRGAVAPHLTIKEPSAVSTDDSAAHLAPTSLSSSGWLSRCLFSRRRLPSAGTSHCGHRLLCLSSVWLVVPSPRFSCRHLPSASTSASHPVIASSCHAHLGPLIRLVKHRLSSRHHHLSAG